jgi:hypothetical protein
MLRLMPTEIHTIWRTAKARCEVAIQGQDHARLMVWVGSTLVYTQVITTFNEAIAIAVELKPLYG